MRIGRWFEPRFVFVCQLVDVIREADGNETCVHLWEGSLYVHFMGFKVLCVLLGEGSMYTSRGRKVLCVLLEEGTFYMYF